MYTSTRQVYGRPKSLPVTENHPAVPIDVNGIHKLAAEYYHLLYDSADGIRSTVLRLTNTYGPRQRINDDRQGVAAVLASGVIGQDDRIVRRRSPASRFQLRRGRGRCAAARGKQSALPRKGVQSCAARPHSLFEFATVLREQCQFAVRCLPFPEDQKIIDIGDYYGDFSAFREATGWEPKTSLEDGLRRTIVFYREQGNEYL